MTTAEQRRISVGIGQLAVSRRPNEILVSYGLGSCVGVSVFDPATKVAGLLHVLLPACEGRPGDRAEPARYADTGVDALLREMAAAGAMIERLIVKVAGGAAVLGPANAERFKIGARNVEAIRERLKAHGLRAAREETGGTRGRTIEIHPATGKTFVRTAASPAIEL
jgi:chemotaxis protein CheD